MCHFFVFFMASVLESTFVCWLGPHTGMEGGGVGLQGGREEEYNRGGWGWDGEKV